MQKHFVWSDPPFGSPFRGTAMYPNIWIQVRNRILCFIGDLTRVFKPECRIMIDRNPLRFHHVMHAWGNLGTRGLERPLVCKPPLALLRQHRQLPDGVGTVGVVTEPYSDLRIDSQKKNMFCLKHGFKKCPHTPRAQFYCYSNGFNK